MEKTLKYLLFAIMASVVLAAPRAYADDLLSDASENSNREGCVASGGKYLYPHTAPRCKCPEGKVNNWSKGTVSNAADICVDDPSAKKGAGTTAKPKKHRAPKVVQVVAPPENTPCELSGGEIKNDSHCNCLKPGTVEGKSNYGSFICVERPKTACELSGGEILPDKGCKCPAGFDEKLADNIFVCKLHEKSACELSGGEIQPDGHCKCLKPGTAEGKQGDAFVCVEKPKTACELSNGQTLPDGHCKCTMPNTMEGRDKDRNFVCVGKPATPSKTLIFKDSYTCSRYGMAVHPMLELKFSTVNHPKYAGGFLAGGLTLDVSKLMSLYVELGLGLPGAVKTDENGNAVLNDDGSKKRWYFSGIAEGGLMLYFSDHIGMRIGGVYEPLGMTNQGKFTYAEAGGVLGPIFAFMPAKKVTLLLTPTLFLGAELSNGHSTPTALGVMVNFATVFNFGDFTESSKSSSSEEGSDKPAKEEAAPAPAPTASEARGTI